MVEITFLMASTVGFFWIGAMLEYELKDIFRFLVVEIVRGDTSFLQRIAVILSFGFGGVYLLLLLFGKRAGLLVCDIFIEE